MAKSVQKGGRVLAALARLLVLAVIVLLLAPIFTVYRMFTKSNDERAGFENDGTDSVFAPLDEIQFIRPIRADIPPH